MAAHDVVTDKLTVVQSEPWDQKKFVKKFKL